MDNNVFCLHEVEILPVCRVNADFIAYKLLISAFVSLDWSAGRSAAMKMATASFFFLSETD